MKACFAEIWFSGWISGNLVANTFELAAPYIFQILPLRRHRHWARLGALMLGSVDLLLLPYGTVLGAYALWTLLREDAKKLFEIAN